MSKFLVAKKQFELNDTNKQQLLISKQVKEISDSGLSQFSIIKKFYEIIVNISFDSVGGTYIDEIEVIAGKPYGELPTPTKSQHVFLGWFTQQTGGIKITSDSIVSVDITKLYAQWELVNIDSSNCTSYEVKTTSSYKNTGIYTASIKSSSTPIYIDWGDGSVEKLTSSISQKSHTYSSAGTFTVKISNNITSFAPSYNNSTWYGTTSQNRYTFSKMISTGSNITTLPSHAFYYCQKMTNIDFMETCFTNVTSLPSYCFYYCSGLTSIQGAKRFTSLGSYCFQYCSGLSGVQNLSNFKFTSLTNSYVFANCTNVTEWILPTNFIGTYFGNYMFYSNTQLSNITLPNTLTSINTYCFHSCSNIKHIIIPQNIKEINSYAFYNCTKLSSINYQTTNLTGIGNYAFYNCTSNRSIQVPDSVKSIGSYAFYYNYNTNASSLNLPNGLTSLGTYAYNYCYNLKNLSIPSSLISIGDYAFAGCHRLSSIIDNRLTAQTVGANTFGNTTGTGTNAYTGYSTRGNNKLSVYVAATGYDESYWNDPLQNPDKGGFQLDYLDPENIKYCNITLNAGNGSVSESTLQVMQGKKIGTLPTPTCPAETPYFGGWYTGQDGTGEKYNADSLAPNQDTLTLYAYYGTTPFASYVVDLNGQWVKSTSQSNPDNGQYDGVYESNSNYNVNSGWAKMYIRISGYTQFTIYIRSYAESSYDYVVAMNLDVDVTSNPSSSTSGVKAHTSGKQNSSQAIGGYTKVEYTNIDGGEHFICVVYRKDSSVNSGNDRGYVLIEQPANPIAITFDIGNGELTSGNLTAIGYQGRPMGNIAPKVQGNSGSPYFVEWNTMPDGSGNAYSSDTMLPISSTLTLYAIYSDQFPYTFVEYLDSSDGGCINTEHTPTLNTSMDFEMMPLEETGSCYVGTDGVNDSRDFRFFQAPGYNHIFFDFSSSRIGPDDILMNLSQWYTISCWNNGVKVNEKQATSSTVTISPDKAPIYALGSPSDNVDMKLKYLKIYENNILVQDLVPVRKGNVGYMYDMVSGKIFENAGTGSFILGPDKATESIEDTLCFEAVEANSTISMQAVGNAPVVSLKTTTDGILWRDFIVGQTTVCLADVGDKVYFKAKEDNAGFGTSTSVYNKFVMTGKINASGNIQSLLYKDEILNEIIAQYCFNGLFRDCKALLIPPNLDAVILGDFCYAYLFYGCTELKHMPLLPATILKLSCYAWMFANCKSIQIITELNATTLATACYDNMFNGCDLITIPPLLIATELKDRCYVSMFRNCKSLSAAPELPATILKSFCYGHMFYGCTSLTSAPRLIASELSSTCYQQMFSGCTKLSSIEVDFIDWKSDLSATTDWLKNVSPTGTFMCPSILPETYGTSYIPEGWNIETKMPNAKHYIQDGLIAMWDGIENAGQNTHDENTTVWKDLVGNSDMTFELSGLPKSSLTWTENSLLYTDEYGNTHGPVSQYGFINVSDKNRDFFNGGYQVAELVYKYKNNTDQHRCYALHGWMDDRYGWRAPRFINETDRWFGSGVSYNTIYGDTMTLSSFYRNGTKLKTHTATGKDLSCSVGDTIYILNRGNYDADIKHTYCIRLYDRALTEEEIQHNYIIDQIRFMTPDTPEEPEDDLSKPLKFTAEQANSTISMTANGSAPTVYLETSPTGEDGSWSDFTVGSTTITLANVGDKVYFRAKQNNQRFGTMNGNNQFVMTGKIAASGNINTLLKADGDVLDLNLTERDYCYANMFRHCTSLTKAPALPATTLTTFCYNYMFSGCTSLTQAPELPATTLDKQCYAYMFYNCTSLTQAPELPATRLPSLCYQYMFYNCSKLNSINVNFTSHDAKGITYQWVNGVASTGTFTCPEALPEIYGINNIPTGWTVVRK